MALREPERLAGPLPSPVVGEPPRCAWDLGGSLQRQLVVLSVYFMEPACAVPAVILSRKCRCLAAVDPKNAPVDSTLITCGAMRLTSLANGTAFQCTAELLCSHVMWAWH